MELVWAPEPKRGQHSVAMEADGKAKERIFRGKELASQHREGRRKIIEPARTLASREKKRSP